MNRCKSFCQDHTDIQTIPVNVLTHLAGGIEKNKHIDKNAKQQYQHPSKAICEIIENLNNPNVNNGFRTRIANHRGKIVQPAGEGGNLEKAESMKYKRYADKIRFSYPVIAEIFDDLSTEYQEMAIKEDKRTKIEKMEY